MSLHAISVRHRTAKWGLSLCVFILLADFSHAVVPIEKFQGGSIIELLAGTREV